MRRTSRLSAAAALVAMLAAGCSSGGGGTGAPAASPLPPRPAPNAADVEFMTGMIHHHAQAIVMGGYSMTRAENPQLKVLSERITVAQRDEIRIMQQWLRENGQTAPEPNPQGMIMNMAGMQHTMLMPGMATEEEMGQLDRARGREYDRLFLILMIKHHEGALQMVEKLFATHGGGVDDVIYKAASDTFADQGSEIDRMQRMLEAMGG